MKILITLMLFVAFLGGCAGGASQAYMEADTLWCHNTLALYAELVADKYADNSKEKSRVLMYGAAHECSWEIEKKFSTPDNRSQACKCTFAANESERIVECDRWLEEIRTKGGCYDR